MKLLQILQEKNVDSLATHAESFFKADHFILYAVAAIIIVYILVKYVYKGTNKSKLKNMTDLQVDNEFAKAPYFNIENISINPDTFKQWNVCKLQPHEDDTKLVKVIDVVHNDDGVIGTIPVGNDYLFDLIENGLEVMGVVELVKDSSELLAARFHIDTSEFSDDDISKLNGLIFKDISGS